MGDLASIPESGGSPGEGNGNPLQYSCLENPMDRGAWRATVHGGLKESGMTEWLHFLSRSWGTTMACVLGALSVALHSVKVAVLGVIFRHQSSPLRTLGIGHVWEPWVQAGRKLRTSPEPLIWGAFPRRWTCSQDEHCPCILTQITKRVSPVLKPPVQTQDDRVLSRLVVSDYDPMDCSPPGSSVHGILQARVLEWVACLPPGDLPDTGTEPGFPTLQANSLLPDPPAKLAHRTEYDLLRSLR